MCTESDERRCWKEEKNAQNHLFFRALQHVVLIVRWWFAHAPDAVLPARIENFSNCWFFFCFFSLSLICLRLMSKCGKLPSSRQSFSSGWVYRTSFQLSSLADGIANRSGKLKRSEKNTTQVEGKSKRRSFSVQRKKSALFCGGEKSAIPPPSKKEITLRWQWASSQHFLKSINRVFFLRSFKFVRFISPSSPNRILF